MSLELFSLKGKTVLITGSSGGIGLHLAQGMAAAGATIILNGRNTGKLDAAVRQLSEAGHKVHPLLMDVCSESAVAEGLAAIEQKVGPVDILVNNAGMQLRGRLEEIDLRDWQRVIDTNLTAAFLVAKHCVPQMIRRRSGKIINICSLMSEVGRSTTGPYTAAKGGLKMLTRAMATEWAQHNIQVNGIGPGYFLTDMTRALAEDEAFSTWLKKRTPAGRWGEPRELVGTAVFLASEASRFINGQIIYVDGGMLAAL